MKPYLKLLFEIGPLAVFIIATFVSDAIIATAVFMVAISVAVPAAWWLQRRIPMMPLVSGIFVLGFGGLTLALGDERFIQIKPTVVNLLFATILTIGLILRLGLLQKLFDMVFQLTDWGWRLLSIRWAIFFVFLAALNEIVWRTQSFEFWTIFKLAGMMPITLVFSMAQLPLIMRYQIEEEDKAEEAEEPAE
jgi:intracellular septation protein